MGSEVSIHPRDWKPLSHHLREAPANVARDARPEEAKVSIRSKDWKPLNPCVRQMVAGVARDARPEGAEDSIRSENWKPLSPCVRQMVAGVTRDARPEGAKVSIRSRNWKPLSACVRQMVAGVARDARPERLRGFSPLEGVLAYIILRPPSGDSRRALLVFCLLASGARGGVYRGRGGSGRVLQAHGNSLGCASRVLPASIWSTQRLRGFHALDQRGCLGSFLQEVGNL